MRYYQLSLVLIMLFGWQQVAVAHAQQSPTPEVCADVVFMMQNRIIPDQLTTTGGQLLAGELATRTLPPGTYADYLFANVQIEDPDSNTRPDPQPVSIQVSNVNDPVGVEIAVYWGMLEVIPFQPLANTTLTFTAEENALYTVVIRRQDMRTLDDPNPINYVLSGGFADGGVLNALPSIDSTGGDIDPGTPQSGRMRFASAGVQIESHVDAVTNASANALQLRYRGLTSAALGASEPPTRLSIVGGDLTATGQTQSGQYLLYVEGYNAAGSVRTTDFSSFNDNQTRVETSWDSIEAVYATEACTGVITRSGLQLLAPNTPIDRTLRTGQLTTPAAQCDHLLFEIDTYNRADEIETHRACIQESGIQPNNVIQFNTGVLTLNAAAGQLLELESTDIDLLELEGRYDITLSDVDVSMTFDWVNLASLAYVISPELQNQRALVFGFTDAPRGRTVRSGENLARLQALNDIVQIFYHDQEGDAGAERLLLPAEYSYIELVTPAGEPDYRPISLPNEPGYSPRALNNTGAECYTVNTLLPEANCPPNGHPNPANNNIWLSITDMEASGHLLDLFLNRSYNSAHAAVDGPFGRGWTSGFLLDYPDPFDPATNSREITLDDVNAYRIGLNLIWQPRGLVMWTTFSGSQHLFVRQDDDDPASLYEAVSMPGWTLESTLTEWVVRQPDGMVYRFDLAGRLKSYGYESIERVVTVDYPRQSLCGLGAGEGDGCQYLITASDTANRRIEFYFDTSHHIVRTVLRDLQAVDDLAALDTFLRAQTPVTDPNTLDTRCNAEQNCFQTRYQYEQNLLRQVFYADGQIAVYNYDDVQQRMTGHIDVRAPIATQMRYQFDNVGNINIWTILPDGTEIPWRSVSAITETNGRTAQVTDEYGNIRTYTYDIGIAGLRATGSSFTLESITGVLEGNDEAAADKTFTWSNGVLTQRGHSAVGGARVADQFDMEGGMLMGISGGLPDFGVSQSDTGEVTLTFADGTTLTHDAAASTFTTQRGATYTYELASGKVATLTRQNDNVQWTYERNAEGLITAVTQQSSPAEADTPYRVTLTYDSFGRLIRISDPTYTQSYCITYAGSPTNCTMPVPEMPAESQAVCASSQAVRSYVAVHDESLGVTNLRQYDNRQRLINAIITPNANPQTFAQWESYDYDDRDRLVRERLCNNQPVSVIDTTYRYESQATLEPLPGTDAENPITIGGYRVQVVDETGETVYVFDAENRLREVRNQQGQVSRYLYEASTSGQYLIRQIDLENNQLRAETVYRFDAQWQFVEVNRTLGGETQAWRRQISPGSNAAAVNIPTMLPLSNAQTAAGFFEIDYTYENGLPAGVNLELFDILTSNRSDTAPNLSVNYDFAGRPITLITQDTETDTTTTTRLLHCPRAGGAVQSLRFTANNTLSLSCEGDLATALTSITRDPYGRPIAVQNEWGQAGYRYTPDSSTAQVQVEVERLREGDNPFVWTARYDALGNLIAWTGEAGQELSLTWDALGNLRRQVAPGVPEQSITYEYAADGKLQAQTYDNGLAFAYNYNSQGRLVSQQDLTTGETITYIYDQQQRLSGILSGEGSSTTYLYRDAIDPSRITDIIMPSGARHQYQWNDDNRTVTHIDPAGHTTEYRFNLLGQLEQITDALGNSRTYRYDNQTRLQTWGDLADNGQQFNLVYTPADGYEVRAFETNSDWNVTLTMGAVGDLVRLTNANGQALNLRYNALGALSFIEDAISRDRWAFGHNPAEQQLLILPPDGTTQNIRYDRAYRTLSNNNGTYTYTYPGDGKLTVEAISGAITTQITTSPGSTVPPAPPQISVQQGNESYTLIYRYDDLLTAIQRRTCLDNVVLTDCPPNRVWQTIVRFEYDAGGRLIRAVDADQNVITFTYDNNNNLISYQNETGETFTYTYDTLNRLVAIKGPTDTSLLFAHDTLNKVRLVCHATSEIETAETCPPANVLWSQSHDALGRLSTQRLRSGQEVIVDYTPDGLIRAWGIAATGGQVEWRYSANARRILESIQNVAGAEGYTLSLDGDRLLSVSGLSNAIYTYDDITGDVISVEFDSQLLQQTPENILNGPGFGLTVERDGQTLLRRLQLQRGDQMLNTTLNYNVITASVPSQLGIQILNNDGLQGRVRLDQTAAGQITAMSDLSLLLNLFTDQNAVGQVQRQQLTIGTDTFFAVTGYDAVGRPVTMNVTDPNGQLLYVLALNYDTYGNLITERRRYADDSQVAIDYIYAYQASDEGAINQLIRREITIIRPVAVSASLLLLLLGGFTLLQRQQRRRLWALSVLTISLIGGVAFSQDQATTIRERYVFEYSYDAADNLTTEVLTEPTSLQCAQYNYDRFNRLTQASRGGVQNTFRYDLFNRLEHDSEWRLVYWGDSDIPLLAHRPDETRVYAMDQRGLLLYQSGANETQWFVYDGQGNVRGVRVGDTDSDLWFYDPLGRPVLPNASLPDVREPLNAGRCPALDSWDLLAQILRTSTPIYNGMMWNPETTLYLHDGRAYDPQLGRYLQPDPQGPDGLGSVYRYREERVSLPIAPWHPPYETGLSLLVEALANQQQVTQSLRPTSPRPKPLITQQDPLITNLVDENTNQQDTLTRYLLLTYHITQGYNLPAPNIDPASGALRVATRAEQHFQRPVNAPVIYDPALWQPFWLPETLPSTADLYAQMQAVTVLPQRDYRTYLTFSWAHEAPHHPPRVIPAEVSGLWNDLPDQRIQPNTQTMSLAKQIEELPALSADMWIDRILATVIPTTPQTRDLSLDDWLQGFFNFTLLETPQQLPYESALQIQQAAPTIGIYRGDD